MTITSVPKLINECTRAAKRWDEIGKKDSARLFNDLATQLKRIRTLQQSVEELRKEEKDRRAQINKLQLDNFNLQKSLGESNHKLAVVKTLIKDFKV